MKAKLIKVDDIYRLINDNNSIIGTTDLEYQKAFSDVCFLLSTKNCQAIENGYDLDELAFKSSMSDVKEHSDMYRYLAMRFFKEGFQKALEILGDKKFSVGDIQNFIDNENPGQYPYIALQLKQKRNEWDVEIELDAITTDDISSIIGKPKLDSDGCLILKRI